METAQENQEPTMPAPVEEAPKASARIVAGVIILLLAGVLAIAVVPGWREAVTKMFFGSPEKRLLQELDQINSETPEEFKATGAELLLQLENTDVPEE
jgi:hypothetical protein